MNGEQKLLMTMMESKRRKAKIAIVHPWFLAHGGAESTVDSLATIFPDADFFTLLSEEKSIPANLRGRRLTARFNWLPFKYSLYRWLMAFYPYAFEQIDLRGYNLVITSDSCVAKCVLTDQDARHICYCHSPMRALWDMRVEFRDILPAIARPFFAAAANLVRLWDFQAAQRVDHLIANSGYVAERIQHYYRRESQVIYPPVRLQKGPIRHGHDSFYLSVCRLTETKRVDLLVQACNRLGRQLVVVGSGRHAAALKKMAGSTIRFVGRVTDDELDGLYRNCRGLLFAADEDFGIVPVEAQGYGRPVIAYGHGGSLETVVGKDELDDLGQLKPPTGVFFPEQTVESVCEAILAFEEGEAVFDPFAIRAHAVDFDEEHFARKMVALACSVATESDIYFDENQLLKTTESNSTLRDEVDNRLTLESVRDI